MLRAMSVLALVVMTAAVAACGSVHNAPWSTDTEATASTTPTMQTPSDIKYYPSDAPLQMGQEHFNRGDYGTAERYFRDAVEKAPKDTSAWVGLAASYDRLSRFDLADPAYRKAVELGGETVQLLNNQGYSYMLRGNLTAARAKFKRALELEPNNPTLRNNIELLNGSFKFIRREPEAGQ